MGIFSFLQKTNDTSTSKNLVASPTAPAANADKKVASSEENFPIDRCDYYYDRALRAYCELRKMQSKDLTHEQMDEIYYYAGNHIGFFLTWVIKHDFIGEFHREECADAVKAVKAEKMTGTQFLIDFCDTKFYSNDIADELIPFVKEYYEQHYIQDYGDWVVGELGDLPLEFVGTWEDYHAFEHVLDQAYEGYLKRVGQ